ncbi:hypothetical protein [Polynucleobacter sp. UK-Kesae-W10]|uniref:hypothetical protein n=1 Tax=Polynucleobacter sp. UK-Kesae-W10 TaxID=1819738 RepID=UPI001C0BFCC0|nr:hypothetical protein [Polynucleobacter sp. UK-Kesae-W10]MBU3576708.1 hypothetical protein [Polynucleobacter sp. UK-Kesae-W10]
MPSRQISPQSFDEILSELGDDPAIPDPHGIRKPSSPPRRPPAQPAPPKTEGSLGQWPDWVFPQKLLPLAGLGIVALGLGYAFFTAYQPDQAQQTSEQDALQQQVKRLTQDLTALQDEVLDIEADLYESIDSIEVSIHLLGKNRPKTVTPKPQMTPFESELLNWRYIGSTQMGGIQQAFFRAGKRSLSFEKGAIVLGDWRLSSLDKNAALFTNAQGKTVTLKTSNIE